MTSNVSVIKLPHFHERLNIRLWDGDRLRPSVRGKLLQDALAFYRFLDVPRLRVQDIILTGSNAAFNYTPSSDIDVHLLVDFDRTTCPELASNLFTTKKALWGRTYDVTIRGQPVELYVEDTSKPVTANGVFSLLHNRWLKHPRPVPPHIDDIAVTEKTKAYVDEIDAMLEQPDLDEIARLLGRLHTLRQNGLIRGGEFSVENLTYKMLRNLGYLQKLYDARVRLSDDRLSLN